MNSIFGNTDIDNGLILKVMRSSLSIQSHFQLLLWMQGEVYEIIPHDVLISFSGSAGGDPHHYDIVSAIAGLRTTRLPHESIRDFRAGFHRHWLEIGGRVGAASLQEGVAGHPDAAALHPALVEMKQVMFHAIPDTRFKADHLYILLRREDAFSADERLLFELLLPHIDAAARKIDGLPVVEPIEVGAPEVLQSLVMAGLSPREIEILEWVRNGKTNLEIGRILDISGNTVKNHLQRIFKKINVSNRAQAVGMFKIPDNISARS